MQEQALVQERVLVQEQALVLALRQVKGPYRCMRRRTRQRWTRRTRWWPAAGDWERRTLQDLNGRKLRYLLSAGLQMGKAWMMFYSEMLALRQRYFYPMPGQRPYLIRCKVEMIH